MLLNLVDINSDGWSTRYATDRGVVENHHDEAVANVVEDLQHVRQPQAIDEHMT